jgi:hypothetical protein
LTESLGQNEQVMIHVNLGVNYAKPEGEWRYGLT